MPHPQSPYYRRNRLEAEALVRYDLVIDAVRRHERYLPEGLTPEDWTAVADHPELFWMVGPLMILGDDRCRIEYYDLSDEDIRRMQAGIDRFADMILDLVPTDCADWDRALYVYEAMVSLVRYREDEEGMALSGMDASGHYRYGRDFSRTIYGPLAEHWGICVGFAMATQYLLQRLGIECLELQGRSKDNRGHAWLLANLDGNYCFIDTTFGRGWSIDDDERRVYIAHEWFGFSSDDISYWDYYEVPQTIPMPEHIGSGCDWFRRTGRFVEAFDAALVDALVERAREENAPVLELKCATDGVRDEVKRYLEERHGLTCYRHRLRVLAAPLKDDYRLKHLDAEGNIVRTD